MCSLPGLNNAILLSIRMGSSAILMRHLILLLSLAVAMSNALEERFFSIENDQFQMDGKPFRIISGR